MFWDKTKKKINSKETQVSLSMHKTFCKSILLSAWSNNILLQQCVIDSDINSLSLPTIMAFFIQEKLHRCKHKP